MTDESKIRDRIRTARRAVDWLYEPKFDQQLFAGVYDSNPIVDLLMKIDDEIGVIFDHDVPKGMYGIEDAVGYFDEKLAELCFNFDSEAVTEEDFLQLPLEVLMILGVVYDDGDVPVFDRDKVDILIDCGAVGEHIFDMLQVGEIGFERVA